jgi:hypothetical protein
MKGELYMEGQTYAAGIPLIRRKSKTTAVLLAIFLGFWTWLYLYKKSVVKFWVNLSLTVVTCGLWYTIAWIWAIVDTIRRSMKWYDSYYEYESIESAAMVISQRVVATSPVPVAVPLLKQISRPITLPDILLVRACRQNRFYGLSTERGLLGIGSKGITYLLLAKSETTKILIVVDMTITILYLAFTIITGFDYFIFVLPLWFVMWLAGLALGSAMKKRALVQAEIVKSRGLDSVAPIDNSPIFDWNQIDTVSVKQRLGGVVVIIKLLNRAKFTFVLLGKDTLFNFGGKAEDVTSVRNAVNRHALGKLNS